MKRFFALLLIFAIVAAFAGCRTLHQAEEYLDHRLDVAEDQVELSIHDAITTTLPPTEAPAAQNPPTVPDSPAAEGITEEQAQTIALEHAGLTEADVSRVYVRADWDDGRQEYDVEFHAGHLEYEYEIDFLTGKILSFDKDL